MMRETKTLEISRKFKRDFFSKEAEIDHVHLKDPGYILDKLEGILHSIPITDLRYNLRSNLGGNNTLEDLILSSELITTRKDINTGIVDIMINFVSNLDEIERYNTHVEKSNKDLQSRSYNGILFDPVHGQMKDLKSERLESIRMVGDNRVSHKSYILLRYQIRVIDNGFVLGYCVYDYAGRIIYYNENSSTSLLQLCYRSVQEIWGHPYMEGSYEGSALIEGIKLLINGSKLSICARDNKYPFFINGSDREKNNETLNEIKSKTFMYSFTEGITGILLPIVFIISFIVSGIMCIYYLGSEDYFMDLTFFDHITYGYGMEKLIYLILEVFMKVPMVICMVGLIGTLYMRKLSQRISRSGSEFANRSKLM